MRKRLRQPWVWLILLLLGMVFVVLFPIFGEYFVNPPWAVSHLPDRIKRLTPGMTREQVWQTLGVRPAGIAEKSGGGRNHFEGYAMPYCGCSVYLVMDITQKPDRLVRGELLTRGMH